MIYYVIYKVTNKLDGKIYIGSHKTKKLDDGYMGSGKYLKHAQNKYGIDNFTKEILFVFDTPELMYKKEAEIVNEDFLSSQNTYNLKSGGFGGFDYINQTKKNIYGKNGRIGFGGENLSKGWSRSKTKEECKKISDSLKEGYACGKLTNKFKDKKHTEEIKKIIGRKSSVSQVGEKNSQFGSCWVTHPDLGNKKIKKEEIDSYIRLGYNKGRKLKGQVA
jgi:hypothetical protein